jgi:hypothetical protein
MKDARWSAREFHDDSFEQDYVPVTGRLLLEVSVMAYRTISECLKRAVVPERLRTDYDVCEVGGINHSDVAGCRFFSPSAGDDLQAVTSSAAWSGTNRFRLRLDRKAKQR